MGGNGLVSGHAYSINKVQKTSQGDVLVRLRNPWGQGEWKGKWCDSDPAWTDALKREMGQSDREDGMFWYVVARARLCALLSSDALSPAADQDCAQDVRRRLHQGVQPDYVL